MTLNPERFGLDAAVAPWSGVRQLAGLAIGPTAVANPILAYMRQKEAERKALFATQRRLELRPRNPILGVGMQTLPPPDTNGRER